MPDWRQCSCERWWTEVDEIWKFARECFGSRGCSAGWNDMEWIEQVEEGQHWYVRFCLREKGN